jgi:hypothetical protein
MFTQREWPALPPRVLILVLDLRKGEWQLQPVGGHPLSRKQVLKADSSTDTLPSTAGRMCLSSAVSRPGR